MAGRWLGCRQRTRPLLVPARSVSGLARSRRGPEKVRAMSAAFSASLQKSAHRLDQPELHTNQENFNLSEAGVEYDFAFREDNPRSGHGTWSLN